VAIAPSNSSLCRLVSGFAVGDGEEGCRWYEGAFPGGLLEDYRKAGFEVSHIPIGDHRKPPLTERQLRRVFRQSNTSRSLSLCIAALDWIEPEPP
jgi:hypothetical protein